MELQPGSSSSLVARLSSTCTRLPKAGQLGPNQCRRRRRWKQEEGKDATSWSAHEYLAQKNRVPTTLVRFQARGINVNFTVGGSVDGKKNALVEQNGRVFKFAPLKYLVVNLKIILPMLSESDSILF